MDGKVELSHDKAGGAVRLILDSRVSNYREAVPSHSSASH